MLKNRDNQIVTERASGRLRVQIDCSKGGRTEQGHRDQCNINTIMKKAVQTGMMPLTEQINRGQYGDYTTAENYHAMQNRVIQMNDDFMKLPSEIRNRFQNDPGQLIGFLSNPQNREEAEKLGLVAKPPKEPEPAPEPKPEPKTEQSAR